jgi:hypothetical protein
MEIINLRVYNPIYLDNGSHPSPAPPCDTFWHDDRLLKGEESLRTVFIPRISSQVIHI